MGHPRQLPEGDQRTWQGGGAAERQLLAAAEEQQLEEPDATEMRARMREWPGEESRTTKLFEMVLVRSRELPSRPLFPCRRENKKS